MSKNEIVLMDDEQQPVVNLRRIRQIDTYEIMESELEGINDASAKESLFLAFFTLCVGADISTVVSLIAADWESAMAFAAVVAIALVLTLVGLVLGGLWWQSRKVRPRLIEKVKKRAGVVEQQVSQRQVAKQ